MSMNTQIVAGQFRKPETGLAWTASKPVHSLNLRGGIGWQSNGGPHRNHPARGLPYSLEVPIPQDYGNLIRVHIAGIFALWVDPKNIPARVRGATIYFLHGNDVLYYLDLICGRHYSMPYDFLNGCRLNGDGSSLEMIDTVVINGVETRIDLLTIDIPSSTKPSKLLFKDLGTSASFVIFDVFYEFGGKKTCPFRSRSSEVSLGELVSIIRIGDRVRFSKAMNQLEESVFKTGNDLDEARGLVLTFLAVISSALLELDAPRGIHRFQLEACRRLDALQTPEEIAIEARKLTHQITGHMIPSESPTGHPLVDRAVNYIERYFASEVNDGQVANHLGLSTSHFRYLFKQTTGQAFHKYLVGLRLERARQMLLQTEMPVNEVAQSVGFNTPVHFSRAFTKRFTMSPSSMRSSKR